MKRIFLTFIMLLFAAMRPAYAQDAAWVQIEAQPSLNAAETRARVYAGTLPDVNGFSLGGGWYAIALGPYSADDAETVLREYRRAGRIPRDSFIAFSASFRQQFWPVGANLLNVTPLAPALTSEQEDTTVAQAPAASAPAPEPEPLEADETLREARASENALSRDEKKNLQIALQWAGFYNAAIDGSFGRGTRGSMSAWQDANGFEATGILTTLQRAELFKQYNAVLDGLDLRLVEDRSAGIEIALPVGAVGFDRYESPFSHYEGTGFVPGAKVILISQAGDENTLFGLYDILQTLEIVPLDGPRERSKRSFTLVGENETFVSHTEASLKDGHVKGFMLIWPTKDEERRTRLLAEMQVNFNRLDGVLDPTAGMDELQAIDLVSGLKIRTPKLSRSGFYVASNGSAMTSLDAVQSCSRITIDGDYDAKVIATDEASGLALLRPDEALAPQGVAALRSGAPRLKTDVAVAGYPFEGALNAPTLTYGTLADLKGLSGETTLNRLEMDAMSGDVGGPVLDSAGGIIGMLAPKEMKGRTLPAGVGFSIPTEVIAEMLSGAGITANTATQNAALDNEDLAKLAADMTVLVSCWE
ncbi:trypsin-like peptidase domain-containing protein [Planktotalea sp.]|uniref:trypsin-like peptidase domain-containing protein n=1 Tax=Planktotalea sp. TaxID=2029877 RepID=UPI003F6C860C